MAAFPNPELLTDVQITSWSPSFFSQAHSLATQARSRGGHRWLIEASLPASLTRAQAAAIFAFLTALRGRYTPFDLALPVIGTARGAGGGTPMVNGADQTGRTLVTDGWPVSTAVLKAGDFLTVAGGYKVYMVPSDTSSDAAGHASIPIEPALVESPADNALVTVSGVSWRVALADDRSLLTAKSVLYGIGKLSLIEVLT